MSVVEASIVVTEVPAVPACLPMTAKVPEDDRVNKSSLADSSGKVNGNLVTSCAEMPAATPQWNASGHPHPPGQWNKLSFGAVAPPAACNAAAGINYGIKLILFPVSITKTNIKWLTLACIK